MCIGSFINEYAVVPTALEVGSNVPGGRKG